MDFGLSDAQRRLQAQCLELAADFATRSAAHDSDGSHPTENYDRLKAAGFLALTIPAAAGGAGHGFLDHTIAFEALGQGCPSTALSFNMHASVVMPVLQSPEISAASKALIADLVVTPGATAYLLTDRFGRMLAIATGIGTVTAGIGAYVSYFLDGATGGLIVVAQTLVFLAVFVFAPKHGRLAAWRRAA